MPGVARAIDLARRRRLTDHAARELHTPYQGRASSARRRLPAICHRPHLAHSRRAARVAGRSRRAGSDGIPGRRSGTAPHGGVDEARCVPRRARTCRRPRCDPDHDVRFDRARGPPAGRAEHRLDDPRYGPPELVCPESGCCELAASACGLAEPERGDDPQHCRAVAKRPSAQRGARAAGVSAHNVRLWHSRGVVRRHCDWNRIARRPSVLTVRTGGQPAHATRATDARAAIGGSARSRSASAGAVRALVRGRPAGARAEG